MEPVTATTETSTDSLLVEPRDLGKAARGWDEQHQAVRAAADLIGHEPPRGLTAPVASAAADLVATWTRHTLDLATGCESRADGLRGALAAYVETDEASFTDLVVLQHLLREQR